MSEKHTTNYNGLSFTTVLGLIFVVLKLTGTINWSWWLVLLPFYASIVLALVILFVMWSFYSLDEIKDILGKTRNRLEEKKNDDE